MKTDLGISPYDSVALILEKVTNQKLPFHLARITSDITVTVICVLFCLLSGHSVGMVLGVGTVCNALLNGPLIRFFRKHIDRIFP